MQIKILEYRSDANGYRLGYVTVRVEDGGAAYVVDFITHLKKGDSEWFAFPSKKKNETQYSPAFQYADSTESRKFLEALKEEYKHYTGEVKVFDPEITDEVPF